jgi:hypothetical protein
LAGHDEAIEEACFQVTPSLDAGLPSVVGIKIVLQRQEDGARLLLTSRQPVNEPAVAISLATDCPQRVSRQYFVLLDPPVIAAPPVLADVSARAENAALPQTRTRHTANKTNHRAAARPARTAARHVIHRHLASLPAPRLVLSGHNRAATAMPSLGLRVDKSLPAPGKYQGPALSPNEISDGNASLNHKLAYLELQLAGLQRRNAELEQAVLVARAPQPPLRFMASAVSAWQAGLALLTGGALLAWRWRSRRKPVHPIALPAPWILPAEAAEASLQPEPLADSTDVEPAAQDTPGPDARPAQTRTPLQEKLAEKYRAAQTGVEVDDSLVDEVEVFMAHGHAELAINLLEEHLRSAPDESPIPWMLLLDLLKRQKLVKDYEQARIACKQHFNIRIPDLDEEDPGPGAAGLEAYPHLLAELTRLWDTPECQAYLDDLIFDRRGGSRIGFDPPTYREIMLLRTLQGDEEPPIVARYQVG